MKTVKPCYVFLLAYAFLMFVYSFSVSASDKDAFQVKGVVVDSVSGKGVSYVTISIQHADSIVKRLASDESGKFSVTLVNPGKYEMVFHSVGYRLQKTEVVLKEPDLKTDIGIIRLDPANEEIGEVTVAVQKPLIRTEPDKIVYSIETDPESRTSSVLEMLRKVPLLTVDSEDNIQMKGSSNFKILINGKSSTMVSQNPRDVLRSLPASTVRDIEVITDPSSKYEAEGTAGIINIITTKKQLEGFMGRLNAGVDSRGGYNTGLYATSKINKFGFSVNYGHNLFIRPKGESERERENFLSATNRYTESEGFNEFSGRMNFLMGEASYEIDTFNLISMAFMGHLGDFSSEGTTMTSDFDTQRTLTRQFENLMLTSNEYGSLAGNIDYQKTFNKPDKTFTLSYRLDHSPRNTDSENRINGILDYSSYDQKTKNEAYGREQTFQVDYYDPLTKVHQIETGVKYILRQNVSNSDILRKDIGTGEWIRDLTRINDLDYDQHILGIYAGYVVKLKKISIKTGLRAETTKNDGLFKSAEDTAFTNRMFNLIPYVTLSKNLEKGQNVKLSYTQRLSRPGIWYLNPFYNDTDPLNVSYGNPELDAEVTHSFQFSYGKFTPAFNVNVNLSSAFTNNSITSYTRLQPDGVSITTFENLGRNRNYGAYIYGSAKPGKKININTNIGINYTLLESNNGLGLENDGMAYNGSLSARYNIWKNGTFSFFGGVYSPRVMLQGKSSTYSYSSMGYSQEFFKKKLSVNLSVTDPFRRRMIFSNTLEDATFRQTFRNYNYYRMVRVYVSYQFGKMTEQIKKAKRTISNDDLKSGGDNNQGTTGGGQ